MRLKIITGDTSREFVARDTAASVTIGRRPGLDVVVDDPLVSELHVRIDRFLETWTFTDQMSDAGTLHNGEARYSGDLAEGDELKLGNTTVRVESLSPQHPLPVAIQSAVQAYTPPTAPVIAPLPVTYQPPSPHPTQVKAHPLPKPVAHKPAARRPLVVLLVMAVLALPVWFVFMFLPVKEQRPHSVDQPVSHGESIGEPTPPQPETMPEAVPATQPTQPKTRLTREEEEDYRKRIEALGADTSRRPEERLAELDIIEKEVEPYRGHSLKYHISRATLKAGLELSVEMQHRYGEDQVFIYRAREEHRYKAAMERAEALGTYLETTEYHKDWARRHQFDEYVPGTIEDLKDRSARWVAEQVSAEDEALSRDDFSAAVAALSPLLDNALLEPAEKEALNNEMQAHLTAAEEQTAGSRAPPRKPFNRRTDKLPPAKPSTLLPQGEYSSLRSETRLRQRLEQIVRAEDYDPLEGRHFGYSAEITAYDYGRMILRVSRPLPGLPEWSYTLPAVWHSLPNRTRGAFYEKLPDLSQNERLAIVMLYFDEALIDDALRAACDLWKAHPEVKQDLDQLIATKLNREVPDGGFVERDGRLVAPE